MMVGAACVWLLAYREMEWPFGTPLSEVWDDLEYDWPVESRLKHGAIGFAAGLVAFVVVLRLLGRRAVRRVLRRRGHCDRCGYTVAGLAVGSGGAACPECAHVSPVCPDLGEMQGEVFAPRTDLVARRFWTPRRLTLTAGVLASAGCVCVAVWGGLKIARHVRITKDAAAASADRVRVTEITSVCARWGVVARQGPVEGDAWACVGSVYERFKKVTETVRAGNPEWADVFCDEAVLYTPVLAEKDPVAAAFTGAVFENWLTTGGKEELARIASLRAIEPVYLVDADGYVVDLGATRVLASSRGVMRLSHVLMDRSFRADDPAAWRAAASAWVRAAELAERHPTMIGSMVATAIEDSLLDHVRTRLMALRQRPRGDGAALRWIDAFEWLLAEREKSRLPIGYSLEGERLYFRLMQVKRFMNVEGMKDGSVEKELREPLPFIGSSKGRLGRYEENRLEREKLFDEAVQRAGLPRWERTPLPASESEAGLVMFDLTRQGMPLFLDSGDRLTQCVEAVRAMAAIERHRLVHGVYPVALDVLAPELLPRVPVDVFGAGQPMKYRLLSGEPDRAGYTLYSIGFDGKDDGGPTGRWIHEALRKGGKGCDALYSEPEPQPGN